MCTAQDGPASCADTSARPSASPRNETPLPTVKRIDSWGALLVLVAACTGDVDGELRDDAAVRPDADAAAMEDAGDAAADGGGAEDAGVFDPSLCDEGQSRPCVLGVNADLLWYDLDAEAVSDVTTTCGASWLRLPMRWVAFQGANGDAAFNFASMDSAVNTARESNIEILGLLMSTPTWATGKSEGVDCGGAIKDDGNRDVWCDAFPPTSDTDWVEYVTAVATHFKGRVRAWEILNEVNGCEFFRPSPDAEAYVHLLELAYDAIKGVDPAAIVVMAGLQENGVVVNPWSGAPCSAPDFLEALYDAGAAGHYDAVAIHPYWVPGGELWEPTALTPLLQGTVDVMATHGDAAPIWITELGLGANDGDADLAGFVEQSLEDVVAFPQVETFFWFRVADLNATEKWGLVEMDYAPKPLTCAALAAGGG